MVGQLLRFSRCQRLGDRHQRRQARVLVDDVEDLLHRAAVRVRQGPAGQLFRDRIHAHDAPLGIGGQHAVANRMQRDGQVLFAFNQGTLAGGRRAHLPPYQHVGSRQQREQQDRYQCSAGHQGVLRAQLAGCVLFQQLVYLRVHRVQNPVHDRPGLLQGGTCHEGVGGVNAFGLAQLLDLAGERQALVDGLAQLRPIRLQAPIAGSPCLELAQRGFARCNGRVPLRKPFGIAGNPVALRAVFDQQGCAPDARQGVGHGMRACHQACFLCCITSHFPGGGGKACHDQHGDAERGQYLGFKAGEERHGESHFFELPITSALCHPARSRVADALPAASPQATASARPGRTPQTAAAPSGLTAAPP